MSKILLVDGNAMLFRAYYASKYVRRMTTSNGIPTNAVYGFITMFKKAMEGHYAIGAFNINNMEFIQSITEDTRGFILSFIFNIAKLFSLCLTTVTKSCSKRDHDIESAYSYSIKISFPILSNSSFT